MKTDVKATLGAVWTDAEAARLYAYRAPYPPSVFEALRRLMVPPTVVLDAGCGTGALTRHLTAIASRVDAIDLSPAMLQEARRLPGGDDARIRWILGTAEEAPLDGPYGLITCGASLHWMDHAVVMPRFAEALAPGGRIAIVDHDEDLPYAWRPQLTAIIERYSPIRRPVVLDLFGDLEHLGLFERHGYRRTSTIRFEQPAGDFVRALQSTSTLSRRTLGDRTDAFADEVRALFRRLGVERVSLAVGGNIVWGRPLRP